MAAKENLTSVLEKKFGNNANDDVNLDWTFKPEMDGVISNYVISPKKEGYTITGFRNMIAQGDNTIATNWWELYCLKPVDNEIPSYNGLLFGLYKPVSPTTVDGEISGTLTDPEGNDSYFSFKKSIDVG
ncbi:hypothetical protein ACFLRB_02770 [Acidobacteriota bacterium]